MKSLTKWLFAGLGLASLVGIFIYGQKFSDNGTNKQIQKVIKEREQKYPRGFHDPDSMNVTYPIK